MFTITKIEEQRSSKCAIYTLKLCDVKRTVKVEWATTPVTMTNEPMALLNYDRMTI
jgi:hypothetical protein